MRLTTIDQISRRSLLEKGLPIHYYFEALIHNATCLRELSIDTLQIVNTTQIHFDENGSAPLPDDFADDVALGFNGGNRVYNLPHQPNISPIRVHNGTTGAFEPNTNTEDWSLNGYSYFGAYGWTYFWNVDDSGGFTGRNFGADGGTPMGYKIIREQRRIQMSGGFGGNGMILVYVSDGQSIDNATQIDVKAIAAIQAFYDWKSSPNAANERSPEGQSFFSKKRVLRARMSELTIEDVKQILRSNYTAGLKN